MFEPDQYQLLDFGSGRKLERFGAEVLDRPSPAAEATTVADAALWESATARFVVPPSDRAKGDRAKGGSATGGKGQWDRSDEDAAPWSVRHGECQLTLQLSGSGNVGLFPEQADNWDWIAEQVARCQSSEPTRAPRVLNLFAYTGGASLAAAAAGAEVAHVDSSGPTVNWARRNADASGMAELPIRWLKEDAIKFVARECKRGNSYDGVIADPPTYGHGPKGKPFKFHEQIDQLMGLCGELLGPERTGNRFIVFSCHAPGFGSGHAAATLTRAVSRVEREDVTSSPLALETADGRKLAAGVSARWSSSEAGLPS